jgi:hypothetical protein
VTPLQSRECPGGCGRRVPPGLYACRECWGSLPPSVRRKINAAWRGITDADGDPTELPGALERYEAAADEAAILLRSRLGL